MSTDIERLKISKPGIISVRVWNELVDHVHSSMVTGFVGGAFARTKQGTQLWARGGAGSDYAPFQVVTQRKPDSSTQMQWAVVSNSYVTLNIGPEAPASWHAPASPSTGANGYPLGSTITSSDPAWITINPSVVDVLFLEYITDYNRISICSNGTAGTFDPTASPWTTGSWVEKTGSPPAWNLTRKVIATATTSEGIVTVNQKMRANQLMRPVSVAGQAAWWPVDVVN